jgi:hypothetical protein
MLIFHKSRKNLKQKIRVRPGLFASESFAILNTSNNKVRPWNGIILNPFFFLNRFSIHEQRPTSPVSCRVELVCPGLGDFENSEFRSHIRAE